jgi:hypothetical protein
MRKDVERTLMIGSLAVGGICSVLSLPESLNEAITYVPINGWSAIHFLTSNIVAITKLEYLGIIVGWEFIEQIACPILFPFYENVFLEPWNDVLSDIMVAMPGLGWL